MSHRTIRVKLPSTMAVVAIAVVAALLLTGCPADRRAAERDLTGAWRGQVQFTNGDFAAVKDLEFMYVFNAGGTMTESSNYDAAPPVPPAYGVWRKVGPRRYEARYEFYLGKAPAALEEFTKGGGWSPDGHGLLTQELTLAGDDNTFTSTLRLALYDRGGRATAGISEGTATGERIRFQ